MASRDKGWQPYMEISGDGGVNKYEILELTSISRPNSPQTQEIRTINNRGQLETELTSIDGAFEIEGNYSVDNYCNTIMESANKQLSELIVYFYPDRDRVENYIISRCILTDYSLDYAPDDVAKFSATFSVQGKPQFVGDVG
jgi:hypothetical protein